MKMAIFAKYMLSYWTYFTQNFMNGKNMSMCSVGYNMENMQRCIWPFPAYKILEIS